MWVVSSEANLTLPDSAIAAWRAALAAAPPASPMRGGEPSGDGRVFALSRMTQPAEIARGGHGAFELAGVCGGGDDPVAAPVRRVVHPYRPDDTAALGVPQVLGVYLLDGAAAARVLGLELLEPFCGATCAGVDSGAPCCPTFSFALDVLGAMADDGGDDGDARRADFVAARADSASETGLTADDSATVAEDDAPRQPRGAPPKLGAPAAEVLWRHIHRVVTLEAVCYEDDAGTAATGADSGAGERASYAFLHSARAHRDAVLAACAQPCGAPRRSASWVRDDFECDNVWEDAGASFGGGSGVVRTSGDVAVEGAMVLSVADGGGVLARDAVLHCCDLRGSWRVAPGARICGLASWSDVSVPALTNIEEVPLLVSHAFTSTALADTPPPPPATMSPRSSAITPPSAVAVSAVRFVCVVVHGINDEPLAPLAETRIGRALDACGLLPLPTPTGDMDAEATSTEAGVAIFSSPPLLRDAPLFPIIELPSCTAATAIDTPPPSSAPPPPLPLEIALLLDALRDDGRRDALLARGTSAGDAARAAWHAAPKLSLAEAAKRTDLDATLRAREERAALADVRAVREQLVARVDAPVRGLLARVAARRCWRALGVLDALAAAVDTPVDVAARALAAIAELLAAFAGGAALLRSGPIAHAAWRSAMVGLAGSPGARAAAVRRLANLREVWARGGAAAASTLHPSVADPADVTALIRAARHYEGAAQALIAVAVATSSRFVRLTDATRVALGEWVHATAPARIDLAGGWSDTPPVSYEAGGAVANVAVRRRIHEFLSLAPRCGGRLAARSRSFVGLAFRP